jgi:hypothetical protein
MIPREDKAMNEWRQVRFSEPLYSLVSRNFYVYKRTMDFKCGPNGFDDLFNTLDTDERRLLIVAGTEKGRVFLIDYKANRVVQCYRSDNWLNSTVLSRHTIICSGISRYLEFFSLRHRNPVLRLHAVPDFEAYHNKGIIVNRRDRRCNIVANIGYLSFQVVQVHSRKVLRKFKIPSAALASSSRNQIRGKSILNYKLIEDSPLVCFLATDDPHLYVFDYFKCIVISKLPLYQAEDLEDKIYLTNTMIANSSKVLVVLLQFTKLSAKAKRVKSVLFVHKIVSNGEKKTALEFMFPLVIKDLEIVMDCDITDTEMIVVEGVEESALLLLGTSSGITKTIVLDLCKKSYIESSVIQKCTNSSLH